VDICLPHYVICLYWTYYLYARWIFYFPMVCWFLLDVLSMVVLVPLTKSVVLGAPPIDQRTSLVPSFRLPPKDPITRLSNDVGIGTILFTKITFIATISLQFIYSWLIQFLYFLLPQLRYISVTFSCEISVMRWSNKHTYLWTLGNVLHFETF